MRLEDIGFYTLSDSRAEQSSEHSPLWRCELLLTARCNFKCPYCRHVGGKDLPKETAHRVLSAWCDHNLQHVRFSGGEPTLHSELPALVAESRLRGVKRVAVSTNGSADRAVYDGLIAAGVNDFSVSLDACCAEDGDRMAGGVKGAWRRVVENIRYLAERVYTTVGVVLTPANIGSVNETIRYASHLGVSDVRVIPAAQDGHNLHNVQVDDALLQKHPILRYRVGNMRSRRQIRGLTPSCANRCGLVLDDMAVMGDKHYPCIIYLREGGAPIGTVGPTMRRDRALWARHHDIHADPICANNCLDVCVDFNNTKATRGRKFSSEHN